MSLDYQPNAQTLVPGVNADQMDATGAGNYGNVAAPSATTGADSVSVVSRNVAPLIGHDQTDGAAVAAALEAKGTLP